MFKYFLKRLAQMLVTLFIVSILVFVLANFIGDPVNMLVSPKAPPEVREQVREELGLNRPILEQYVSFVTNAFKGDFGKSYIYKVDVLSLIAQRVPATLELVFVSVVLALVMLELIANYLFKEEKPVELEDGRVLTPETIATSNLLELSGEMQALRKKLRGGAENGQH